MYFHKTCFPNGYLPLSLFHKKISASVTKSSHQDCGLCYLHLPVFCSKIKSSCAQIACAITTMNVTCMQVMLHVHENLCLILILLC